MCSRCADQHSAASDPEGPRYEPDKVDLRGLAQHDCAPQPSSIARNCQRCHARESGHPWRRAPQSGDRVRAKVLDPRFRGDDRSERRGVGMRVMLASTPANLQCGTEATPPTFDPDAPTFDPFKGELGWGGFRRLWSPRPGGLASATGWPAPGAARHGCGDDRPLLRSVFAWASWLGSDALSRIVKGRWAPWTIGPAIGMSLAALGIEAHDMWRTAMNAPAMAETRRAGAGRAGGSVIRRGWAGDQREPQRKYQNGSLEKRRGGGPERRGGDAANARSGAANASSGAEKAQRTRRRQRAWR